MKAWMIVLLAIAGGVGYWLYSKYRKETAEKLADVPEGVAAVIKDRPAGVTVSEAMKGITTELVKTGLEEFGVNINPAVDVVARQAGMLDSDISALARRAMEGQDITQQLQEEAETYGVDAETLLELVAVSAGQKSDTYYRYAAEKAAGTYTKPYYTYQHEATAAAVADTRARYEEFRETRQLGETMRNWEKRVYGSNDTEPLSTEERIARFMNR